MQKQKGITLIALVITIIVMIILMGTAITIVVGDGKLLQNTTNVRTLYKIARNGGKSKLRIL